MTNVLKVQNRQICVVRHGYYPDDTRVLREVRTLLESGYSVDVICLKKPGQPYKEIADGVRIYRIPNRHKRSSIVHYIFEYGLSFLIMGILVTIFYLKRQYSCIQINTLPDGLVFITVIPRLLGTKVLLDMHEPTPELWITKYGTDRFLLLLKLQVKIEKWAVKYANKVITVNETLRDLFVERGASKQKIEIIRNVPPESFNTNGKRRKINNHEKDFILITHGTIEQRYGQEVIIKSLPFIREKIENLKIFIVGMGEHEPVVQKLTKELGCSDIVSFTGYIPFTQIKETIDRADIGLVPLLSSPFAELCQPNKLFEYIALKKPVISSRLKAIEESFDDTCITFFEPGNHQELARCILYLYDNPQKGRELAENAYHRYQKLRWDENKKCYLNVIESLTRSEK